MSLFNLTVQQIQQGIYDFIHQNDGLYSANKFKNIPYIYFEQNQTIDDLLTETKSVFRSNNFNSIVSYIFDCKNVTLIDKEDFDILTDSYFGVWLKPKKKLAIFKFDFSNIDTLLNCFDEIIGITYRQNKQISDNIKSIFNKIQFSSAAYAPFSDVFGILMIDLNNINKNIIKHELIHFIEDVTGNGILSNNDLLTQYLKYRNIQPIYQLKKLLSQKEICELINLEYYQQIFNKHEMIPYINSLCYQLEELQAANKLFLINDIFKNIFKMVKNRKTINEIVQYVTKKLPFLRKNINKPILTLIVLSGIYKVNISLIKKIVGNYFKDLPTIQIN